jgi:hypothetical protein
MKLNKKFIAVPAIALGAGMGLAACGTTSTHAPAVTHTVIASPAPTTPKPTTPAATTPAPAPAKTVYVQPAAPAPAAAPAAPVYQSSGNNCGGGVNAGPNTSCPFAENVAADYNGPGSDVENVYSPVTGESYTMYYTQEGSVVYATGGNDASVQFDY